MISLYFFLSFCSLLVVLFTLYFSQYTKNFEDRNYILIYRVQKNLRLLVATADGYLYVYSLNTIEGGECVLLKTHKLSGLDSEQTDWIDGKSSQTIPRDIIYNKGRNCFIIFTFFC